MTKLLDLPYDYLDYIYNLLDEKKDRFNFRTCCKGMLQNNVINSRITHLSVKNYIDLSKALDILQKKVEIEKINEIIIDNIFPINLAVMASVVKTNDSPSDNQILDYLEETKSLSSYKELLTTDKSGKTLQKRIKQKMHHPLPNLTTLFMKNNLSFPIAEAIDFAYICPSISKIVIDFIRDCEYYSFRIAHRLSKPTYYQVNVKEIIINGYDNLYMDSNTISQIFTLENLENLAMTGNINLYNGLDTNLYRNDNIKFLDFSKLTYKTKNLNKFIHDIVRNLPFLKFLGIPNQAENTLTSKSLEHLFIEDTDFHFEVDMPLLKHFAFGIVYTCDETLTLLSELNILPIFQLNYLFLIIDIERQSCHIPIQDLDINKFKNVTHLRICVQELSVEMFRAFYKIFPNLEHWQIQIKNSIDWEIFSELKISPFLKLKTIDIKILDYYLLYTFEFLDIIKYLNTENPLLRKLCINIFIDNYEYFTHTSYKEMIDTLFLTQNISIKFLLRSTFVPLPTLSTSTWNIK